VEFILSENEGLRTGSGARSKGTDSPFLQERGEGIGPIWSNTYPPTPFQMEGGVRN